MLYVKTPGVTSASPAARQLAFVKVRYKDPDGTESRLIRHAVVEEEGVGPSADFRFASAVAGFGMLLRASEHRGDLTTDRVLALARAGLGEDREGYRRGFVDMVEAYRSIVRATAMEEPGR